MILIIEMVVWISLITVLLTYLVYPMILRLLRPFHRSHKIDEEYAPLVTLVISAYNEAAVIREKIENSLALDYPQDKLEIVVISDESDDGTDEIVAEFFDRDVVLCRQEPRQGKSAGLTRFVPQAQGEIVVFSDANSIYQPDALRKLVRHFADSAVGFSVGYQRYVEDESATTVSESLYWEYETWIKVQEGRLGSVVCGDGAIYAIRSELFEPLRPDDINDFYLPLRIVSRGYRGIFDREAVCDERTADSFYGEFRRKIRIVNRSLRAVSRVPQVLNPFHVGLFAVQLSVHKVLRWFVPFFLVAMLAGSAFLATQGSRLHMVMLAGQSAFYGLAFLGVVPGLRNFKPVYVASYFCLVNAAAGLGILGFLFGHRFVTWRPERTAAERESQLTEHSTQTVSSN